MVNFKHVFMSLLFSTVLFAQTILNQTFDDFSMRTDANTIFHLVLDSAWVAENSHDGILFDLSSNNIDFNSDNFSANFVDEIVTGSPIYANGNTLRFTATNSEDLTSKAVPTALNLAVTDDTKGVTRPQNSVFDMGAFEYYVAPAASSETVDGLKNYIRYIRYSN